jgi:NAD(P)-dependent dehydrogenase (short-subunit alcohol dehydrogenase family)
MTSVGIVTGAASGIGAATAERLVGTVDVLVLADIHQQAVEEVAQRLASDATRCDAVAVDISDPVDVERLAAVAAAHGTLRRVAHVAGISPTMGDWRAVLDVDLVATARILQALFPLATDGTAIVCVASMAAHLVGPYADPAVDAVIDQPLAASIFDDYRAAAGDGAEDPGMAYAYAKRGVMRLVQRESVPFGQKGARVCSVSPGTIDTPMGRQELERQPQMAMLDDLTPLGRNGRADELAAVIAFLLSDDASYVTGIDLLADGGTCAGVAQAG